MLNAGLWPPIPEQGSVGASGDLAPLAHLALALIGEGDAVGATAARGGPRRTCFARAGLEPVTLGPEGRAHAHQRHAGAHGDRGARAARRASRSGRRRTSPARCRSRRCSAPRSRSTRASTTRAASSARRHRRRCCASCSPTARSASRIARAIRACRTPTRCAACRRCTVRCSTRSTSPTGVDRRASSTPRPTTRSCSTNGDDARAAATSTGRPSAMALDLLAIALTNLATITERRIDRLVHPDLNQGLPPFLVDGRRRELRLHDGAGDRGGARQRVQGALAPGERRHDPDRRQQGRRRADGDGRGVASCGASCTTCGTCSRIELMCARAGDRLPRGRCSRGRGVERAHAAVRGARRRRSASDRVLVGRTSKRWPTRSRVGRSPGRL